MLPAIAAGCPIDEICRSGAYGADKCHLRRSVSRSCLFRWPALAVEYRISLAHMQRQYTKDEMNRLPKFPDRAESLLDGFRTESAAPGAQAYQRLFQYFLEGFLTYRLPKGAGAAYPGLGSNGGTVADRLEGFSRNAPLWAAWMAGGRPSQVRLESGDDADLLQLIRAGLLTGTDPASRDCWGAMGEKNPRIVEAADIALVVWLTKDALWRELPDKNRQQIAAWLQQAERNAVWDNNWHLFPVLTTAVLRDLGLPADLPAARQHYADFKRFHLGSGWFSDGKGRKVDYYNAWGIHYPLWWLRRIDPEWDNEFLGTALEQFLSTYKYLIGPEGFPVMGRSVCYRMAAPSPLVLAQADGSVEVSTGQARRGLDAIWTYFIRRGAVRGGNVTQAYCGGSPDWRIMDNYSGPASCLWSLRSLVAAFYLGPDHQFWTGPPEPLPVEISDFSLEIPAIGWTVVGDRASYRIEIRKEGRAPAIPLIDYGVAGRVATWILQRPVRPWNTAAKYEATVYSSDKPFCGCGGH